MGGRRLMDMTNIAIAVDQERAEGLIGASDAAGILGLDRFRPPIFHWRRLRGLEVDDAVPAAVQEAALWGQALEPVVRGRYALTMAAAVFVPGSSYTKGAWLRATPDGIVFQCRNAEDAGVFTGTEPMPGASESMGAGLLQVKTCSAWLADEWESGPPAKYEVQCRVEMAVCDLPWDDIVCLIGGQRMVQYRVHRDMEIEARILTDLRAFWDRVQSGREPDVDGSEVWKSLAASRMRANSVETVADVETLDDIERWREVKRARAVLDADERTVKNRMLLKLGAAGATRMRYDDGHRRGMITAYQIKGRVAWEKYAMSIGGNKCDAEKFRADSKAWGMRTDFGNDDEE